MRDPRVFTKEEITKLISLCLEGKSGAHTLQPAHYRLLEGMDFPVKELISFQTSLPSPVAGD